MMYFFDFDRTLFDTDAYSISLADEPGCAPFAEEIREVLKIRRDRTLSGGKARRAVWAKVSEAIRSGALTFPLGALSRFLYPDVAEVFRHLGNEAVIISYGERERQKFKIENAFATIVRLTVLYTGEETKTQFLSTWPGYYGQEAVLVDDRVVELEELSQRFPALRLYEMRRDGKMGDGRFTVVRSLNELP